MQTNFIINFISGILLVSSVSFAQSESSVGSNTATTANSNADTRASRFSVALKTANFDYEEPGLMKDSGRLNGLTASFFQRVNPDLLFRGDADYLMGTLKYDGALMDGTPISTNDQKYRVINLSGNIISNTNWTSPIVTAPFAGLGYRDTFDDKDNSHDYRRDNSYIYGALGAQFEFNFSSRVLVLLKTELDILVGGQNKTYLSDVGGPDLTLKFKSGSARKVSLEFYYTLVNHERLQAELSYTQWAVADSEKYMIDDTSYLVEPSNKTTVTSFSVGYLF